MAVDGFYSSLTSVRSGVPQGSVLGPLLFIIFTTEMWCGIKNNMIVYADNSTLHATIKSSFNRLAVAESLNLDLKKIESWCGSWSMCLNPRKSTSVVVTRSRTINPPHPYLIVNGLSLAMNDLFKKLSVLFNK